MAQDGSSFTLSDYICREDPLRRSIPDKLLSLATQKMTSVINIGQRGQIITARYFEKRNLTPSGPLDSGKHSLNLLVKIALNLTTNQAADHKDR